MEPRSLASAAVAVEVYLAHASVDATARGLGWLDAAERRRADAFRSEAARDLFVAARATLRIQLGRRLGGAPETIRFGLGDHGKPTLAAPWDAAGWHFNVSHSGTLALVAIARSLAVGIDVERIDAIPAGEMEGLSASHFSAAEMRRWRAADAAGRTEMFFRVWTRKEAVLKAWGVGFVDDLAAVDTVPGPRVLEKWSVRDWAVPPGYVAAVAAEGLDWEAAWGDG